MSYILNLKLNMKHFAYCVFIFILLFIQSCSENPLRIDVSDVDVDITIERFDLSIDSLRTDYSEDLLQRIIRQYPDFLELYSEGIIRVGSPYSANYIQNLNAFFEYPIYKEVFESSKTIFADYKWIEEDLENALKHYKHYFPHFVVPHVYTFLSGFNQSIVIDSALLAIGLDKYLGAKSHYYKQLGVERYLAANMQPSMIVVDCMKGLLESESSYNFEEEHLLAKMIHEGKLMYCLKAFMPEYPDSLLMGYTEKQMEYCDQYEENMWNYLVEKKLLFNSEHMNVIRFVGKAPFTAPFSHDSPGRTGVWLGYRIVSSYMLNNHDVSLSQLLAEDDFQKIMNKSKYKP